MGMLRPIRSSAVITLSVLIGACTRGAIPSADSSPAAGSPPPAPVAVAAAPTPPPLPAYYIESLRARPYPGGRIDVGRLLYRGAGFAKYEVRWPSGSQTMTGTIAIPDGPGPDPVVIVNHGFIPTSRYSAGADSGIYGDALAGHGFIAIAPNYPGYSGSGPGPSAMPHMVATAITVMDLVSSLTTLPEADPSRVTMIGHSFGGGVSLLVMVVDPRVSAFALYGPVSSDMRDSARKWWLRSGSQGPLGDPDVNPDGYAHISPRNYFDSGPVPVLIMQGTLDEDIPAGWTTATVDALNARAAPVRLDWFPGAYHSFVGSDLATANARAETWFREAFARPARNRIPRPDRLE